MCKYQKIATLTVKDGTYEKQGREYSRYRDVGVLLSSPHGSRQFIKLYGTAFSEPKIINIVMEEGKVLRLEEQTVQQTNQEMEF